MGTSRKGTPEANLAETEDPPPKVDMDFTDLNLTAYGGSSTLAQTARQYGLFELLDEAVPHLKCDSTPRLREVESGDCIW